MLLWFVCLFQKNWIICCNLGEIIHGLWTHQIETINFELRGILIIYKDTKLSVVFFEHATWWLESG
jgi:hypothetical protein